MCLLLHFSLSATRANLRSPFENSIDREANYGVHCEAKANQLTDKIDMKRLLLSQSLLLNTFTNDSRPTSVLTQLLF